MNQIKEKILKVLYDYSENSGNPYFDFEMINSEYIPAIAEEIVKLIQEEAKIGEIEYDEY